MIRTRHGSAAMTAVVALVVVSCGNGADDTSGPTGARDPDLEGEITVSAAASLTEAYTQIGEDFEAANPGATITFTFDSSTTLADQIIAGAPADVFASADEANVERLRAEQPKTGTPEVFARNHLVIVTKPGNPEGVEALSDLAGAGIVSLCGEDVPCGKATTKLLDGVGVDLPEDHVTRGQNVKAALGAVTEGDAVAGIVYVSDAASAPDDVVDAVTIPEDDNVRSSYPVVVVADADEGDLAQAFIDHVLGDEGQAVLEERGFLPPT